MTGHVSWVVERKTPKGWVFVASFLQPTGSREEAAIKRCRSLIPGLGDVELRARRV